VTRMRMGGRGRNEQGLTFIEMLAVVSMMVALTLIAWPYLHHKQRQLQEIELRRSLNLMRDAIDHFHELAVTGQIEPWDLDWMMYPKDLEMLIEGVEVKPAVDAEPILVRFLREIPIDPITGEREWQCRAYDDDVDDFSMSCDTLYDVASTSNEIALDGSTYADW